MQQPMSRGGPELVLIARSVINAKRQNQREQTLASGAALRQPDRARGRLPGRVLDYYKCYSCWALLFWNRTPWGESSRQSAEVVFAPRSCNKVAKELAAFGAAWQDARVLWAKSVPEFVNDMLASEYAMPG
jgi:hypothetical protein